MTTADELITDYLSRLRRAGGHLPPEILDELVTDIRAHLDEVLASADGPAEVHTALDRLGTPEEVVAAAAVDAGGGLPTGAVAAQPPGVVGPRPSLSFREIITVLLLVFGTVVMFPLLGPFAFLLWIIGVALLWSAPAWTPRLKTLGTLVWPGGLALPLVIGLFGGQTCITVEEGGAGGAIAETTCQGFALPVWIGLPLFAVLLAAPIVVGVVLLRRAHREPVTA